MSEMAIMDRSGDTKLIWDPDNADEVANAKRTFDDLLKKGFMAFKVEGRKGDKGEQIKTFDPKAEKLILTPAMAGG
jgi:hypothetical protein